VTNFAKSKYDIKVIMNMSTLPIGRRAKRTKVVVEDKKRNVDKDDVAFSLSSIDLEGTWNMSSCRDGIAPTTIIGHAITSKTMENTNEDVMIGSIATTYFSCSSIKLYFLWHQYCAKHWEHIFFYEL
jgi:hypothetical protein